MAGKPAIGAIHIPVKRSRDSTRQNQTSNPFNLNVHSDSKIKYRTGMPISVHTLLTDICQWHTSMSFTGMYITALHQLQLFRYKH